MNKLSKNIANETRKTLDVHDLRAMDICGKTLRLFYKKEVSVVVKADYYRIPTGSSTKILVAIEGFSQSEMGEPAETFKSTTEFWFEQGLWIPRVLRLKTGLRPIEHFICDVDRGLYHYTYKVKGPIDPRTGQPPRN